MAIGLEYGRLKPEESAEDTYRRTKKVVEAYELKYKTTACVQVTRSWREILWSYCPLYGKGSRKNTE